MMNCTKHWNEHAVAQCDACGQAWYAVCLVPPPKDGGPLRCIPCSLVIAGVRTGVASADARGSRSTAPRVTCSLAAAA